MARPNPYRFTYRSKGTYWRFRHKVTGDVPMPHVRGIHWSKQPEQAAWARRYADLLEVVERHVKPVAANPNSFRWLVDAYLKSAEFSELADSTQRDYTRTCGVIVEELGDVQFALATRTVLKAVRDDHSGTVRKAHKIKQMLSRLYSWADENDLVPIGYNPAKGIKRLKQKGGAREIVVWSDAEIEMVLAAAPLHVQTPVMIALYTGQRIADVAQMTWQQYQGDVTRVRQSKTGAMLDIACHPVLRKHLEGLARPAAVICTTAAGRPFTVGTMSGALRRTVKAIEALPDNRSMHGLRYAAGSRMEEAGCSVAEIESVLGHQTFKMALKYASQRLRAKAAMAKMEASGEAEKGE